MCIYRKEAILLPENIVYVLNQISAVKGQEYAKGFVDGVNLMAKEQEDQEESASEEQKQHH